MRLPALRLPALCLALVAAASSALAGIVEERLPQCLACHGATGASEVEGVPSLGGQPSDYVLIQLYLFREDRGNA